MKIITPGKAYELSNGAVVEFLSADTPNGITTEEMLQVVRHRVGSQGQAVPGRHTMSFVALMDKAMACLAMREGARKLTGTLGTGEIHDPIVVDAAAG